MGLGQAGWSQVSHVRSRVNLYGYIILATNGVAIARPRLRLSQTEARRLQEASYVPPEPSGYDINKI